MIGLLGKKIGMTQIFDESGHAIPVTVLEAGPCVVTAVRVKDKHGYNAIQLAFGEAKEKRLRKSESGFFKKLGVPLARYVREIRTDTVEGLKVGDEVRVDNFETGDYVDVIGVTIGKGFQGVVKRHRFRGGPKSHGSMFGRVPGSIGASSFPSRVVKGMRAPGHMGDERLTMQNLKVIKVDSVNHLIAVRGAVPGVEDGFVILREALKRPKGKTWKVVEKAQPAQAPDRAAAESPKAEGETQVGEKP
jgi:large subunit ribosomal protein L3